MVTVPKRCIQCKGSGQIFLWARRPRTQRGRSGTCGSMPGTSDLRARDVEAQALSIRPNLCRTKTRHGGGTEYPTT